MTKKVRWTSAQGNIAAGCKSISGRHKFSREIIFDRDGGKWQKCLHCDKTRRVKK